LKKKREEKVIEKEDSHLTILTDKKCATKIMRFNNNIEGGTKWKKERT